MMRKILVIGKSGQIGSSLLDFMEGFEYTATTRAELDLAQPQDVYDKLKSLTFKPDIIINAAAYTAVDMAEAERDLCNKTNHLAVSEIARFCNDSGTKLIHYSTDYVFNGVAGKEFREDNTHDLAPLNYYGFTKLAGEKAVLKSGCDYMILRISWVYNHSGKNFVKTILKLASEKEELRVISDQIGCPAYAHDITKVTMQMLDNFKPGIYNITHSEKISWHDFAVLIIEEARRMGFTVKVKNIEAISSTEYETTATRPHNSVLSAAKLHNEYQISLPPLKQSLSLCLERIFKMKKILICIISYNATNHIIEVLSRIPKEFLFGSENHADIAVFDDASKDNTYELALEYAKNNPGKIKVFKNSINQGYGGNQKIAYSYAIKHGYDIAVMLHGDAQYAPELLPDMCAPIVTGNYDVVLGSRMIDKKKALHGKMPKYKFLGNVALTTFQNIVLGAKLSEYHTGYRAYSMAALQKIPFQSNSDYFEFDTDILIQMIDKRIPIKEISIPTHYGTEVCNVNVVKYGLLVLKSTLLSRLALLRVLKIPRFNYGAKQLQQSQELFAQKLAWLEIEAQ